MPSQLKIAFAAVTTDGYQPTHSDEGLWNIFAPASAESLVEALTTNVDAHVSVVIPNGWYAQFNPRISDLAGAADCFSLQKVFYGTGAAQTITVQCVNNADVHATPGTNDKTLTAGLQLGALSFHKMEQPPVTFSGTFAS